MDGKSGLLALVWADELPRGPFSKPTMPILSAALLSLMLMITHILVSRRNRTLSQPGLKSLGQGTADYLSEAGQCQLGTSWGTAGFGFRAQAASFWVAKPSLPHGILINKTNQRLLLWLLACFVGVTLLGSCPKTVVMCISRWQACPAGYRSCGEATGVHPISGSCTLQCNANKPDSIKPYLPWASCEMGCVMYGALSCLISRLSRRRKFLSIPIMRRCLPYLAW